MVADADFIIICIEFHTQTQQLLQVFEDALDEIIEDPVEEPSVNINNNKTSKLSVKTFKLKRSKTKKKAEDDEDEEEVPLELGIAEGQQAIDLFFDNRFEDSKAVSQKQ